MLALVICSAALPARAADEPKEKRELLAKHETLAIFDGVAYQLCKGLTALCPDRCGDSGEFASFAIKKYLKYEKLGQYGDPEQETFAVQVSDYYKKPKGDPKILETVKGLKKGDYVLLSWHHDYVTKEGASSPERPIMKLEKVDGDKAKELLSAPDAKKAEEGQDATKGDATSKTEVEVSDKSPPNAGTKTSFKGWELYVWQKDGDTNFSLLEGTNRLKTDEEIAKAAVKGIEAIKPKLDELKPGQEVVVLGKNRGDTPPKDQSSKIQEYGKKIGLTVQ